MPAGELLHAHRNRSFVWGYGHILLFGSVVATGAGLHSTAYYISHESKLGAVECVLAVAIPVGVYILCVFALYFVLVRSFDTVHILVLAGAAAVLTAAIALAAAGVNMALCHVVVMFAPMVPVVGFELVGHRHAQRALARASSDEL